MCQTEKNTGITQFVESSIELLKNKKMTIKAIVDKIDRISEYQPGFDLLLDRKFAVKYRKAYKSKLYGDLFGIFPDEFLSFGTLRCIRNDYLQCREYLFEGDFYGLSNNLEYIGKEGLSETKKILKTLESAEELNNLSSSN